jgi:hypothetical protein
MTTLLPLEDLKLKTEIDRKRTMTSSAQLMSTARSAGFALVQREAHRTGSKMVAYENVASAVGASSSWLRRFVKGYPDAGLSFVTGCNLIGLYEQWCVRVEKDNTQREEELFALREQINAATPSAIQKLTAAPETVVAAPSLKRGAR